MHLGVLTPIEADNTPFLPAKVVDVNATLGGKLALFGRYNVSNASLVLAVQNPFANLSCTARGEVGAGLRAAYGANLSWDPSAGAAYAGSAGATPARSATEAASRTARREEEARAASGGGCSAGEREISASIFATRSCRRDLLGDSETIKSGTP